MTNREVLEEALFNDPNDLVAWLAYADVCEETGDLARAHWVRVRLRRAQLLKSARTSIDHDDEIRRLFQEEYRIWRANRHRSQWYWLAYPEVDDPNVWRTLVISGF